MSNFGKVAEIEKVLRESLSKMVGKPTNPPNLEAVKRVTADYLKQMVPTEEVIFSLEENGPGRVTIKFNPEQIEKLQREGKL